MAAYIETTLDDIAIANELATSLFGQSLDELSRPGRELLQLIFDYVQSQAAKLKTTADKIAFGRRELREALKWSEYQLRTYLHELETLEYIWPLAGRQGQPFRYRLLWDGQGENGGRFLAGLKSVEQLRQEAARIGLAGGEGSSRAFSELRGGKTPLRGEKGNFEGTSWEPFHEVESAPKADETRALRNGPATSRRLAGEPMPALQKTGVNGSRVTVTAGGRV